ncbi:MAG: type I-U CRISPR-associated protein Csx17 [Mycobacterium sp.]
MSALELAGSPSTSLAGYLGALGIHRAVARLLDDTTEGWWRNGAYLLRCRYQTREDLAEALHAEFEPESIVAPWNSGSGFSTSGTSPAANAILDWVRNSTDRRLEPLRLAVSGGDKIIAAATAAGIDDVWDKKRKPEILQLCRNELPDAAIVWMDAALALGQGDGPTYSRLLGTGGNFGRQELSVNYLQQARLALENRHSGDWLLSALDGAQRSPYPENSPGQFDPGGAGIRAEEETRLVNPWSFLFVIEGVLLFATAVVRRYGAAYAHAALPFQVSASTAGFDSSAAGETPLAELWTPEWSCGSRIPDIAHLLGEGRADWNAQPARSGLDMARAAATLGVDRGLTAFDRYVFVDRLGQNPMAVPAGRVEVGVRGGVDLLEPLDRWREALHRIAPPGGTAAQLRTLDQAIFDHARTGTPEALVEVFTALGRCRAAAARSGTLRAKGLREPRLPHAEALWALLRPTLSADRELRIAAALASSGDRDGEFADWLDSPPLAGGLAPGLADIARRRGFPLATHETLIAGELSVRGPRIALEHGLWLRSGDVAAFVAAQIDDERTAALILGLACIDWHRGPRETLPGAASGPDPAVDLLLPFTGARPLDYTTHDGQRATLLIRPGHDWIPQLAAGHVTEVLQDATRRLRIAGLPHVIAVPGAMLDGTRAAGALLMTTPPSDRRTALARIAVIGSHRSATTQEETP